jgi:hypothetical protein
MYWELACRPTVTGFTCELPIGIYYIGDFNEILDSDVKESADYLYTGVYEDAESDGILMLHQFNIKDFMILLPDNKSDTIHIKDGYLAIINRDILKDDTVSKNKFVLHDRHVLDVNTQDNKIVISRNGIPYVEIEEGK